MNLKALAFIVLVISISLISILPQADSVFTGTVRRKGKKVIFILIIAVYFSFLLINCREISSFVVFGHC